jgi:hypothetical protein
MLSELARPGSAVWVPVTPTIVALPLVSGATSLVTTEGSAPESIMKITG